MKIISNLNKWLLKVGIGALVVIMGVSVASCDPTIDALAFDLPEANSKEDLTPPTANFKADVTNNYLAYTFSNTSSNATNYVWDYGDGKSSTGLDGENIFPGEGTYTVTLTATDKLGKSSSFSSIVEVVEPEIPPSIFPVIINGDFEDSSNGWKPSNFTGANKNGFNSSSDGSLNLYDGSTAPSKTKGAKYDAKSTMVPFTSDTRAGYQEITISPNTIYILEFVYSIDLKNAVNGNESVVVEILDGWFPEDAKDAYNSSKSATGPLVKVVGTKADGKGNFNVAKSTFTSNATGKVSIWMYGITTTNEVWADNVKVYPVQ